MKKEIEGLITKAAAAVNSDDALRFSQAACNAANAANAMVNAGLREKSKD